MRDSLLIVLYDQQCGLCDRSAAWLARRNSQGRLLLAPNQGVTATIAGEPEGGENTGLVAWQGSRRFVGAPALAAALKALGGIWSVAGWLLDALPSPLANGAYRLIAARRQRISTACGWVARFKADLD
jgi:predicted DCC family thiol-disulfide oxidoreductase YuxK